VVGGVAYLEVEKPQKGVGWGTKIKTIENWPPRAAGSREGQMNPAWERKRGEISRGKPR